jgi:hypothetical protein
MSDPKAIHIWSAYLGAALGRLRCQVSTSKEAVLFQTRTYRIVGSLPPMVYQEIQKDVRQTYAVGADEVKPVSRLAITTGTLNPCQQEAWLVAERIGEFGHPLVRQFLDAA